MSGIFINYRGDDGGTAAALIDRELTARFGGDLVFLDSRSLPVGADFAEEILDRLRSCSVLLVVMGSRWLTVLDGAGGRRIDNPTDWVRCEIVEALGRQLRVIPVLLDGTTLPTVEELPSDLSSLGRRQYVVLRHRHIDVDLADLVERVIQAEPGLAGSVVVVNGPLVVRDRDGAARSFTASGRGRPTTSPASVGSSSWSRRSSRRSAWKLSPTRRTGSR